MDIGKLLQHQKSKKLMLSCKILHHIDALPYRLSENQTRKVFPLLLPSISAPKKAYATEQTRQDNSKNYHNQNWQITRGN